MNEKTNIESANRRFGLLSKALMLLLVACVVMVSCKNDDDEVVEINDQCYISSVKLGQMKRIVTLGENADSTGEVTFTAGTIPMIVDQRANMVQNSIPLPQGSVLGEVSVSVEFKGVLTYSIQGGEEIAYASDKPIDCTNPVTFIVRSTDGTSSRRYTLKLTVDKQGGTRFVWTQLETNANLLKDTVRRVVVGTDGSLVMLGCQADGMMSRYTRTRNGDIWSREDVMYAGGNGTADIDLQTLTLSPAKDKLLMSTKDGSQLLESTDGISWTEKEAAGGKRLVGSTSARIYAFADGLLYSKAEGEEWKTEVTDAQKDFTPLHNVHLLEVKQDSYYTRLVLVGYASDSGSEPAIVWEKQWRTDDNQETNKQLEVKAKWMSYPHERTNRWLLPRMQPLFVMPYSGGIVAFGGQPGSQPALSKTFYTPDFGLTWKVNPDLTLHGSLSGAMDPLAATLDGENFIWVVTGNDTWCGRLN